MLSEFTFARTPRIIFGADTIEQLPDIITGYGNAVLLVTGLRSYQGPAWDTTLDALQRREVRHYHVRVIEEPSPEVIDSAALHYAGMEIQAVAAWGGGSVVDAGKAISAMLPRQAPVTDYLEGVGEKSLGAGEKVPFIAVPTTAGTGSEATKNAVISRVGEDGFKKSLRHDNFVPDVALIDPKLMLGCPRVVTAACGLDAFTQLIEAYVSTGASPMTSALAWSGMERVARFFLRAFYDGKRDLEARAAMAYAALTSGITLANAGLGVVHGIAGPLGARFDVPHGAACGNMLPTATRLTIDALHANGDPAGVREQYAAAGRLLAGTSAGSTTADCDSLIHMLEAWVQGTRLPRLGRFGVTPDALGTIAAASGNKNNPAALDQDARRRILAARL